MASRSLSRLLIFPLALCALFVAEKAQAQHIVGRWEHQGPRGVSFLTFAPGELTPDGVWHGHFDHTVILDNGVIVKGRGWYTLRPTPHHKGVLFLHFSDGFEMAEREHVFGCTELVIAHHHHVRAYRRIG